MNSTITCPNDDCRHEFDPLDTQIGDFALAQNVTGCTTWCPNCYIEIDLNWTITITYEIAGSAFPEN